jgi:NAD(P)H-dependent flavin oxidoreductase YrpB (nitropropane dioxygenase family)
MGTHTRLTEALGITVPILSAPMGFVAGGKLAAAVTAAGGLGIIGGGYGDGDWLDREFAAAFFGRVVTENRFEHEAEPHHPCASRIDAVAGPIGPGNSTLCVTR